MYGANRKLSCAIMYESVVALSTRRKLSCTNHVRKYDDSMYQKICDVSLKYEIVMKEVVMYNVRKCSSVMYQKVVVFIAV